MEQLWLSLNLDLNSIQACFFKCLCRPSRIHSVTPIYIWWRSGFTALIYVHTVLGGHGTEAAWGPRAHRLWVHQQSVRIDIWNIHYMEAVLLPCSSSCYLMANTDFCTSITRQATAFVTKAGADVIGELLASGSWKYLLAIWSSILFFPSDSVWGKTMSKMPVETRK